MRLGVGLPTFLGRPPQASLVVDWARAADEAGFAALGTHDRPSHWTWEPLTALAAASVVTTRIRLMTSVLLLPAREERHVAKQAAVVDQLSGGRLELGLAPGARPQDFDALGGRFEGRGPRFDRQLEALEQAWAAAQPLAIDAPGPPPVQHPHPPLWLGGYTDAAIRRALRHGHGYIFGAVGIDAAAERAPEIRRRAREAGRTIELACLAYVAVGADQRTAEEAERRLLEYYGTLRRPFDELVHRGDPEQLVESLAPYRAAGIDLLLLMPSIPELSQLDALARGVLPRLASEPPGPR